jgi:hypothetical protein
VSARDITERLREWSDGPDTSQLTEDAADTIDALRSQVAALQADAERVRLLHQSLAFDGYGWWFPDMLVRAGHAPPSLDDVRTAMDIAAREAGL